MNVSNVYVEVQGQLMEKIHRQKQLGQHTLCQICSLPQPQEWLPSE